METEKPKKEFDGVDETSLDVEESRAELPREKEYESVEQHREVLSSSELAGFNLQAGLAYENFIRRIYPEELDDILELSDYNPQLEAYITAALILADHLNRRAMPKSATVLYNTVLNLSRVRVSHRRMGRSEIVQMMSGTVLPPEAFEKPEEKKKWWARLFE